jgi:hypothetical protein
MNQHREPRGGRSLPFAVSKELAGSWAALCPLSFAISKERQQTMGRTPLTEQAIAASANALCEILLSLVVFFAFGALCACAASLERKREKPARDKSLLFLCVVQAHSSA